MATQIQPAQAADEQAIKRLLVAAGLPVEDVSATSLAHFLLLREGGEIVGVVGLDVAPGFALLRSLAVADSMRNRGLGDHLVRAVEALAAQRAIPELWLLTTTADRYFASRGYTVAQRAQAPAALREMPQFKSLCPSTSVLMTKRLQAEPAEIGRQ
jgi:N-acetylglutamate synthase-like GNAT family acetyltransferase